MSPSDILWFIGSGLFNLIVGTFFYMFLMGRKVQRWDSAADGVDKLEKKADGYERRISFLEGRLDGKTI